MGNLRHRRINYLCKVKKLSENSSMVVRDSLPIVFCWHNSYFWIKSFAKLSKPLNDAPIWVILGHIFEGEGRKTIFFFSSLIKNFYWMSYYKVCFSTWGFLLHEACIVLVFRSCTLYAVVFFAIILSLATHCLQVISNNA